MIKGLRFKIGDKVKVKSWKSLTQEFGGDVEMGVLSDPIFFPAQKRYCGRTVTISKVIGHSWLDGAYQIKEDNHGWLFAEDVFEEEVM